MMTLCPEINNTDSDDILIIELMQLSTAAVLIHKMGIVREPMACLK